MWWKYCIQFKICMPLNSSPAVKYWFCWQLHLTLYYIQLGTKMSSSQQKNFSIPPSIMADMDRKMQYLTRLKQEMAMEEKMLEVISISKREKLLQNTFTLSIQVQSVPYHRMLEQWFLSCEPWGFVIDTKGSACIIKITSLKAVLY